MELTNDELNRLAKLVLTAADQTYGPVWQGVPLAPINNFGGTTVQPYTTPSGFVVVDTVSDPTTGFRAAFYKNFDTNEVLAIPVGTDGINLQDYAADMLYTGYNQWNNNAKEFFITLGGVVDADTRIYFGGQSLGGALAQFAAVGFTEARKSEYITVTNPETNQQTQIQNPLYVHSLDNTALVTFASPGITDQLLTATPGFDPNNPEIQQIASYHYTTQGEAINMVGGAMVGSNTDIYYLPTDGQGDVGYLHRITLGFWDSLEKIDSDFAGLTASPQQTLDTADLQQIGAAVALIGSNGQMDSTESAARMGVALLVGAALSPPGDTAKLVSDIASRYLGEEAGTAIGAGVEVISKMLLIANPIAWLETVIAELGIANLAHLTSDQVSNEQLAALGFDPVHTGLQRTSFQTYDPAGNLTTVVKDTNEIMTRYQVLTPDGGIWKSSITGTTEVCTSPAGFTVTWQADSPYATLTYGTQTLGAVLPNTVIKAGDLGGIVLQQRSITQQNLEIQYMPPPPGSDECGVMINGEAASISHATLDVPGWEGGGKYEYTSLLEGTPVLTLVGGGDGYILEQLKLGEITDGSEVLRRYKTQEITNADGSTATVITEQEIKVAQSNGDGSWSVVTERTGYGPNSMTGRIKETNSQILRENGQLTQIDRVEVYNYRNQLTATIETTQLDGQITQTVSADIGGNHIVLKYAGDSSSTIELAEVVELNGSSISDQAALIDQLNAADLDAKDFIHIGSDSNSEATLEQSAYAIEQYEQDHPSVYKEVTDAIDHYGPAILDALSLVKAIQSGEPLPITVSGLRLTNDLVNTVYNENPIDAVQGQKLVDYNLSGAANVGSGILSLMSLDAALKRGDTLAAVTAGAQAITFGATAYANFVGQKSLGAALSSTNTFGAATEAIGAISDALPYLSIINSLAHGDEVGAAVAAISIAVPAVGWAYAVYTIVDSIFNSEDIPDPWGSGQFVWDGTGIKIRAAGETGGEEAVTGVMQSTLATLNALIEQQRQANPGSQLGIIPNRMPTVGYDMSGYRYTDIDPLTGEEQHPALRFDTDGNPYNAEPGSDESYQSIVEGMIYSALEHGAIAPQWEVQTARMQAVAGDPKAGLTEEARAGRDGKLAAPVEGDTQIFRPVMLDLDGDGIETIDRDDSAIHFDVDDSGYLKHTGWLGSDDAFLTLDRNYNGQTDSGKEMFSNAAVDRSRRGLAGMAWVDANYDGKLTSADPVWDELKLWRDLDQNGMQDEGETVGLDDIGISELNYSMSTFTQDGIKKQLGSPDQEADKEGTRVSVVPEGILIQESSEGHLSLLVTRIDDKAEVEANRDGVTGYEDVEVIVSTADLLANDTLGGVLGRDLNITGLTNFRHGTGFIDTNGFVHFTPKTDYSGDDAGFDYVVSAENGQEGTATVDVVIQGVNDAPTLDHVDHTMRSVYGYTDIKYDYSESGTKFYYGGGNPIYSPYGIVHPPESGDSYVTLNPPAGKWYIDYHTTRIAYDESGAGRITGADPDDDASTLTYELVNAPQYGSVNVNPDGTFKYTGWRSPDTPSNYSVINGQYAVFQSGKFYTASNLPKYAVYPTQDVFQVRITDPHGASTIESISVAHYGPYIPSTPSGGGGKPIAVDLNGDGFSFVDLDDSNVFFDVNGDGWKNRTAWVGKDDGLLVYDVEGDGLIDKSEEISFAGYDDNAQTDLEGLAAFDSNGDGRFDADDEKWAQFGIWQDANQNGITDEGELRSLSDLGVTAVELTSDGQFQIIDGQTVHGIGSMSLTDGSPLDIADVTLAFSNEVQIPQADGSVKTASTSPFSPSGEEINGTEQDDLILGKSGNNIVNAFAGDDVILEDGGNDIIDAGDGNDQVYSGADNDLVFGGDGNDTIHAGLGSDIVFGGDGHDALFAEGGNDLVFGGAGNDLISGGWGNDVLSGDEGDDRIFGESGRDALFGGDGNDELLGMDDDDYLNGGAGNDRLDGGSGADEMIGGPGNDTYLVDNQEDKITELADEGNDTVITNLDNYVLSENFENLFLSNTENDSNPDGSLVATTAKGNMHGNIIRGNLADNLLYGYAGDDRLDGGAGVDILVGGTGNDTYVVDNTNDVVVELVNEGHDTVLAEASYTLGDNVEDLMLMGSAALSGTGNSMNNILTGNNGSNLLDGGAGADRMFGGLGNDTYVVDDQADNIIEFANEGNDTVVSSLSWTLGENLENLRLTGTTNIDGTGNNAANLLIGNSGSNRLDGGHGADTLAGGAGDDTYVVDNAGDTVVENASEGIDTIYSSISYVLPEQVEHMILTGSAATDGTGNALDNSLTGNAAANTLRGLAGNDTLIGNGGDDLLDGGSGADIMLGGTGDDLYYVDEIGDQVIEATDEGIDTVHSSISYTAPDNVERIELLGSDDIDATGNTLDNTLVGNGGANTLKGLAGNDTLIGNGGDDTLDGGRGADIMTGGTGDDLYYVDEIGDQVIEATDEGIDTVHSSISYTAPDNVERIELLGSDDIDATGNTLDNTLVGNGGANTLKGLAGNDTLIGNGGDDTLDGGSGADIMTGGAGNDIYIVDNADDKVIENANEGIDTIYSSISYVLPEQVEHLILTGSAAIDGTGNALDNTLTGNDAANTLLGLDGNDTLIGNGGDDRLDGGAGDDLLNGGLGDDTYIINLNNGLDRIEDIEGTDTVRFGEGLNLDNVALRVTQENGVYTAHIRVLDECGCEQPDQGFDLVIGMDDQGRYISPIERFIFADDSQAAFDDLLIKTVVHIGTAHDTEIVTGRNDDVIYAGPRGNTVYSGTGHDIIYAGSGGDQAYGEGGNDVFLGSTGDDVLDGGCGDNILFGYNGRDVLRSSEGNNILLGGSQDDLVEAGSGADFIAGGSHNDTIQAGGGSNVIAFNLGDGRDTVLSSADATNTLSLGGGIQVEDLAFRHIGPDLLLEIGNKNGITFKDWYQDTAHQSIRTLQVIDTNPDNGSNKTTSVELFDFQNLVEHFDTAQSGTTSTTSWSLMNGLLDAHLENSTNVVIGGELAMDYAEDGAITLSAGATQKVLSNPIYGSTAQTVGRQFNDSLQAFRIG
ncbi:cadherin-like domain-containing protein [Marinobacterium sp. D7]|uniref:cadherin-like domain-containing protein n=1 Tax=Marinobacterium ramblicola TaxID=2849041 RepID=UPI001C2D62F9|nr:cadherin-like domain-containing protein [Marinobacterium ramblicola]MBV1786782.1 cadherin-like domain-containing protein [Marinobacterium ramblicola]